MTFPVLGMLTIVEGIAKSRVYCGSLMLAGCDEDDVFDCGKMACIYTVSRLAESLCAQSTNTFARHRLMS